MMSCKEVLQQLSSIVDKEAPMMKRWSFFMHIAMCRNCRKYFKQFKQVKAVTEQMEDEDFSEDFFAVMERALAQLPDDPENAEQEDPQALPASSE